jgi:DNA-binding response OmpR family regulator
MTITLMEEVWMFLSKLRKYLREDPQVEIINVHGKGYKLLVS